MMRNFLNPALLRQTGGAFRLGNKFSFNARFMATVQTSPSRRIPEYVRKATPISHERATFTIKVC
jgi:hypothetical protein